MTDDNAPEILWTPRPGSRSSSEIGRFLSAVEHDRGLSLPDYNSAWAWSVDDLEGFWSAVWDHFDIKASTQPSQVLSSRAMPGAQMVQRVPPQLRGDTLCVRAHSQAAANAAPCHHRPLPDPATRRDVPGRSS